MDKYYYLAAQLPILVFDTEPDISAAAFLHEAEKWLSPPDMAVLRVTKLGNTDESAPGPGALRTFIRYEHQLRTELAEWRLAQRDSLEFKPRLFPATLIQDNHPLAAEKELLRLRWNLIADLQFGHYSDIEFMIFYYLKLQILERLQRFDQDNGREKFQSYTETGS